ncbi:MAG: LamG domain-containing protein, partial [Patescibacteria group bacterium]
PIDYGDPSLVGYWTFNEGTGSVANDASGHGKNGTLSCDGSGCTNPSWVGGKVGSNSLYFNPATSSQRSYVTAASINNSAVSGSVISISLWANPDATQINGGWFIRNGTGADENYGFNFGTPSGGNYGVAITGYYDGAFRSGTTAGYFIPASVWSHIVLVFVQGQTMQVYLNGTFQQTVNYPYINGVSVSSFNIGGHGGTSQAFNGFIDDVRIYSRALTTSEILALYNATK